MKNKIFYFLFAAVFILTFAGCSGSSGNAEETSILTTNEEPQPYPLTVNDTEITKTPEKIICLSPFLAEILFEMDCGSKIIARSSYCDYPEEILSAEEVGNSTSPDIDKIIGLTPDLVLLTTPIAARDSFRLNQAGIACVTIPAPSSIKDLGSIYSSIGLIMNGLFTGKEKGEAAFSPISQLLANPSSEKVGTFIYVTENLDIATGDTFESDVLSCFGTNLAQGLVNYEADKSLFLDNQPDVIILNNKYTIEDLQNDENLSQLEAVKNNRILFVDNEYFERPSARISNLIKNILSDYKKLIAADY